MKRKGNTTTRHMRKKAKRLNLQQLNRFRGTYGQRIQDMTMSDRMKL